MSVYSISWNKSAIEDKLQMMIMTKNITFSLTQEFCFFLFVCFFSFHSAFLFFVFLWESSLQLHFQALQFAHKLIENELLLLSIIECKIHLLSNVATQRTMIGSMFQVSNIWNTWKRLVFTCKNFVENSYIV